MKRALKGNGSITQLPSGKWLVKIPVGRNAKGATRYLSKTLELKSEARRWQSSMLAQRENQTLVAGPRQTLRQYATEVLLNTNDRIADRTRDGYYRNLRKHVFPELGSRPLLEIKPQELERLLTHIRSKYSASTVNNVRTALSKVFSTAVRHELVLFNPVARTQKAKRGSSKLLRCAHPGACMRRSRQWRPQRALHWKRLLHSPSQQECGGESS